MKLARRLVRTAISVLLLLAGAIVLYCAAALAGAVLRPPAGPQSEETKYPVVLVWSEIHTDIVLPVRGLSVDWSTILAASEAATPAVEGGFVAFGWGSESFYTSVPTLADISVPLVIKAMFFDTTVVHVAPVADASLIPSDLRLTFMLSAEGMTALERHVLGSFALRPDGTADALTGATYGYGDAFYRGNGRYNPIGTCNQWTSDGLRRAGVSVGYWTPFSQSITWALGTDADRLS